MLNTAILNPHVLSLLGRVRHTNFLAVQAYMAREFLDQNFEPTRAAFAEALDGIPLQYEAHVDFKKRVPSAIGLIRTGDTIQYANLILVSG